MAYWDQKLEEAKQKVQRRRRLAAQLEELKRQEAELAARAAALDKSRIKEESDVDRLEGGTLSAFLLRMRKDREERLGKERAEAFAAQVKYGAAVVELAATRRDMKETEDGLSELSGCEEEYAKLSEEKKAALLALGRPEAERLFAFKERISYIENQKRETAEALQAGEAALETAGRVADQLGSAEVQKTAKLIDASPMSLQARCRLVDEIQRETALLQSRLRRFRTELADIAVDETWQIGISEFLRFSDALFDGLFEEGLTLSRTREMRAGFQATRLQIRDALGRLSTLAGRLEEDKAACAREMETLLMETEVQTP